MLQSCCWSRLRLSGVERIAARSLSSAGAGSSSASVRRSPRVPSKTPLDSSDGFVARAGLVRVDRGLEPQLDQVWCEADLAVGLVGELFDDGPVDRRIGMGRDGGDHRERAPFRRVAGRAEQSLGAQQCARVEARGQDLARVRQLLVVGADEVGERVEHQQDVAAGFDLPQGLGQAHLGESHVPLGRIVEGGGDHFAAVGRLHSGADLGDVFGAFVDEAQDCVEVLARGQQRRGPFGDQFGAARARRGADQDPLAEADGRQQVEDPRRLRHARAVERDGLGRAERCSGSKRNALRQVFDRGLRPRCRRAGARSTSRRALAAERGRSACGPA